MSPVVADLHVHTTRSDGAVEPEELPAVAAAAGLEAVAITDHDRLAPIDAPAMTADGVTVHAGIELRVEAPQAGRVDLLGYGLSPTDALAQEVDRLQADRRERARRMQRLVEAELDVELDLTAGPGVGRPHIARAVAEATELSPQAVFDRYIGEGRSCYVPRRVPAFEEGRRLLVDAGAIVVLAHPLRYDEPETALGLVDALDGVEVTYPYGRSVDRAPLEPFTRDDALVRTGGSDAHTLEAVGRTGLDRGAYQAFLDAAATRRLE